ncbi:hypothetical protein HQO27_01665 [Rhodococcus fascians]|nr:hypothetical protein [Rhodococcus fascians]MBY4240604.1 hypothetical protein [Rhodococcus fascians]MBY4253443.1 hypothetical protein [Rhodococcus fascians]MBY4269080.1 hypothetical protein [Rhodococcus fascians]MBY4274511.1 hypothetical protein [Rhodococcus fascians]
MNPSCATPADAVLQWTVLIAKAAALGVLDVGAETDIPQIGFRTRPAPRNEGPR